LALPFNDLSNDPEQQYFADGVTEDLTTDLSRLAGMLVISRNTAFTYKGKRIDVKQIGREVGVRYVLEGKVERSGNLVRINTQLIDVETDAHLWAERFEGDTIDLFAIQNEVVSRIANTLNPRFGRHKGGAANCQFRCVGLPFSCTRGIKQTSLAGEICGGDQPF